MNDALILEVAARWEVEAAESMNNSKWSPEERLREAGHREGLRRCADTLRLLVSTQAGGRTAFDPLDFVIQSLLRGMNSIEREQFREPDQRSLKEAMRFCGMTALPNSAAPEEFQLGHSESECSVCGKLYCQHPFDWRVIGYGNVPFLNVLCDGRRVKL